MSCQQASHQLEDLGLSSPSLAVVRREGFNSIDELQLCARPHLVGLLGPEVVDEIELGMMRFGLHFSLSRGERLEAIKQMAVATLRLDGPTAAKSYFIEALTSVVDAYPDQPDGWKLRVAYLMSGPLITADMLTAAIDAIYGEMFPKPD